MDIQEQLSDIKKTEFRWNVSQVEEKWQSRWEKNQSFKAEDFSDKPKFYLLRLHGQASRRNAGDYPFGHVPGIRLPHHEEPRLPDHLLSQPRGGKRPHQGLPPAHE